MRIWCHLQPLENLGTHEGVQIVCTSTERAPCIPPPSFAHYLVALVRQYQCTKFCVASSTFQKIRGSSVKKESASSTRRAYSHGASDTAIACPTALPIYLASFRSIGPPRWPAALNKHDNVQKGCKSVARALHAHLAPQRNYGGSNL